MSINPTFKHDIKSPLTAVKLGLDLLRIELNERMRANLSNSDVDIHLKNLNEIIRDIDQKIDESLRVIERGGLR